MRQQDRLFWTILVTAVLVLLAAGVVVALRQNAPPPLTTYLPDESDPAAVVYNAYVAARQEDVERFLGYFETSPWERPAGELAGISTFDLDRAELRIGTPTVSGDTARVPVTLIRTAPGPFFGSRISVQEETVTLKKTAAGWRIKGRLPFVYPHFTIRLPGGD